TASTISSAGTRSFTGWTRPRTASGSAPPFSASFVRLLRIVSSARSTAPGTSSWSETRRPEAAITCAIPPPICPAPTTRTCSNLIAGQAIVAPMPYADVNGASLWYEEEGEGPAVLFVHGGLGDLRLWEPEAQALASRFRCIR